MTHHPIKILEDGTRVYSNYTRYKPMPKEQRVRNINKPDVPGAVLYHSVWFLPLEFQDMTLRKMPETRPDTDAYEHMTKRRKCRCVPCQRPSAKYWQDKWRRDQALA